MLKRLSVALLALALVAAACGDDDAETTETTAATTETSASRKKIAPPSLPLAALGEPLPASKRPSSSHATRSSEDR